jgi:hypothetical protein
LGNVHQHSGTTRGAAGDETPGESETYWKLLARAVKLTGQLLVHDPLAGEDVEEIGKRVELVVVDGAEGVEDLGRVVSGGGGRSGVRVGVVESVHGSRKVWWSGSSGSWAGERKVQGRRD